ncbi:RING finger protein 151-like [Amblyomma americanum]
MAGTEYTGFDDFPERQRVVFVEPLPVTRVCGACGVLPSRSVLLPCGHVLCQVCKDQTSRDGGKCALDGMEFAEDDILPVNFKQSYLEQHRVFCVAGGEQCTFDGRRCDLKDHLTECGSDKVRCDMCQQSVVRSAAVEHYRRCSAESSPRKHVSSTPI